VLSHPEVSFQWIQNGKTTIHSSGDGSLTNAVYALYGRETARHCLVCEAERDGIRLTGLLGRPEIVRASRAQEHLFINGRPIQSPMLARAVERGYGTLLMVQKFPFFVLNVGMNPERVDVNVHPNKLQVRFWEESAVFGAVMGMTARALEALSHSPREFALGRNETDKTALWDKWGVIPSQSVSEVKSNAQNVVGNGVSESRQTPHSEAPAMKAAVFSHEDGNEGAGVETAPARSPLQPPATVASMLREYRQNVLGAMPSGMDYRAKLKQPPVGRLRQDTSPVIPVQTEIPGSVPAQSRWIGTAFETYLLLEEGDKLYLVDQHAAHERLLYDQYLKEYQACRVVSQTLLIPGVVNLAYEDRLIFEENRDVFARMGFEAESYGGQAYRIIAVPQILGQAALQTLFTDLVALLREPEYTRRKTPVEEALLTAACRGAVKAGDPLSREEVEALLEILRREEVPLNCPHGRPICMALTRAQIEKQFRRTI